MKMNWMNKWCILFFVGLLLSPVNISAEPFEGTELLIGRSIKQPGGAKTFSAGLDVQFAPLNVLLSSQKANIMDAGIASACAQSGNAQCEAEAQKYSEQAMDELSNLSEEDWAKLEAASSDAEMTRVLGDAGVDTASVEPFLDQFPESQRKDALKISKLLASKEATTLMLEPHIEFNFDFISIGAKLPLALVMFEDSNEFNLGNATLDLQFGHVFGIGAAHMGISYGASVYFPSGSG